MAHELLSDTQLLQRAQQGDRDALGKVLRAQYRRVFAVCLRMMRSRTTAEDQTQEALMRIARGLSNFEGKSAFSTWCHRVATTTCLDELRRQRRRPTTTTLTNTDGDGIEPVDDVDITAGIKWSDVRADIRKALDAIPVEFARAVVLRDVLELEYQEIADLTGVATGTVRSRISRGRALLAQQLGGNRNDGVERLTNGDNE